VKITVSLIERIILVFCTLIFLWLKLNFKGWFYFLQPGADLETGSVLNNSVKAIRELAASYRSVNISRTVEKLSGENIPLTSTKVSFWNVNNSMIWVSARLK
jgi:hypothetical protein